MLKQIANSTSDYPYSLVDTTVLQKFFTQSVRGDNFSGLGHLLTYAKKYGIQIGEWNLGQFKTALDFHLNQRPNLNNVLIFTKYYTYFHQCRLSKELKALDTSVAQLSEGDKYALNSRVFNQPTLVDMRSLFGHLVKSLGERQAIDPVTKEDALWQIVEFFSKPGVNEIAQYGQTTFNSLEDSDISAFLVNRLNDTRAFEKITQILIRLKDRDAVHNQLLQALK